MSKTLPKISMAIAPVALFLAGCASVEGDFPSLSKRSYEGANSVAGVVIVAAPFSTGLPSDLQAKVNALVARARTAQAAFDAALPNAVGAAQSAAGGAIGSESWVNAHVLLSRADATRSDAVAALGEIDQLIAGERDKGADSGLVALLSAPQSQIAALVSAQNAEIERLAQLVGL